MNNFREEVMSLAREKLKTKTADRKAESAPDDVKEVMNGLLKIAELAVSFYNQLVGDEGLSVYSLPGELLALFLNLSGKRVGFCLVAPEKFVVFLDDEPGQVVVFGKKRQNSGSGENLLTRARQLIKVSFVKTEDGYLLKDNTGSILDPEEMILHIIRWAVSE
ncbi:MAG TPA: hypothetical protein VNN20_14365 [Thermodesulfobacteriota bacterium]|nr:hypothetical protein [Thermodesulfobacteriota bacterium]